jgi:uncharacterized membrane protein
VGILVLGPLHVVETRRYRADDTRRSRVRLVEEDLLAPTLDPGGGVEHTDWRTELAEDLRDPAHKIPFVEAYTRRLRRVSLPLFLVVLAAWVVRILLVAPGGDPFASAAVFGLPGRLVVASVAALAIALLAVAFWPRSRKAKGELQERGKAGDRKDE